MRGTAEQQSQRQGLGEAAHRSGILDPDVHSLRLEDQIPEGVREIRVQADQAAQIADEGGRLRAP